MTTVVVGNGLFGAATARHLAERGHEVVVIGAAPTRLDVRDAPESAWPGHRVYSSHNDAARLTRRLDRKPAWAEVTARAIDRYRALEAASGISFFHDVGCLIAARPGGNADAVDPITLRDDDLDHVYFGPGDRGWRDRWPELDFPDSHYVAYEPSPAGYIRPKPLIEAQNRLARRAGATIVAETVTAIERVNGRFVVAMSDGPPIDAERVIVAAGAFTNFNGLLPARVELTLKSEVIVLGEVDAATTEGLGRYPTVTYQIDPVDLDDIYMVPPVRYEDGRYYVKMGANTRLDRWFTDLDEIQRWFNADTDPDHLPMFEPALRALWPEIDFLSIRTQPCIITYTADRMPRIEHLGDGLFVATAGNGGGAKGSDAWGENVALLVERT